MDSPVWFYLAIFAVALFFGLVAWIFVQIWRSQHGNDPLKIRGLPVSPYSDTEMTKDVRGLVDWLRKGYPAYSDLTDNNLASLFVAKPLFDLAESSQKTQSPMSSKLSAQMAKITDVDVDRNRVANWWNTGQVESVRKLFEKKALVASQLSALQSYQSTQDLVPVKEALDRALIQNQIEIAARSTALGIPVAQYGSYMLEVAKGEIQTKVERISVEETLRAALLKASLVFENQQRLINEISTLELNLLKTDNENIPSKVKRTKKKYLRQLISVKEAELRASQQTTVSPGNGSGLGQLEEDKTEPAGPAE